MANALLPKLKRHERTPANIRDVIELLDEEIARDKDVRDYLAPIFARLHLPWNVKAREALEWCFAEGGNVKPRDMLVHQRDAVTGAWRNALCWVLNDRGDRYGRMLVARRPGAVRADGERNEGGLT
jgi:hypothetical protein